MHGRSLRKGVRFSVQTCSDARMACRSWWGCVKLGSEPSAWKVRTGEVVRCSSRCPRDAQKRPASPLRRPDHRWSRLGSRKEGIQQGSKRNSRCGCALPHPRPEFRTRSDAGLVWVAPRVIIPFSSIESEVKLRDSVFTQELSEREREEGIMLRYSAVAGEGASSEYASVPSSLTCSS